MPSQGYVAQKSSNRIFFRADVTQNAPLKSAIKRLPPEFVADEAFGPRAIRSSASVPCKRPGTLSHTATSAVINLNRALRRELFFINGTEALWYIKSIMNGPSRIQRQLPTL